MTTISDHARLRRRVVCGLHLEIDCTVVPIKVFVHYELNLRQKNTYWKGVVYIYSCKTSQGRYYAIVGLNLTRINLWLS